MEKSFDPAVGVVIDGVPISIVNGTMVNTFDFASMEVLRGPQGTLFGKNTTGGVINVQRTRPTGELGMRYEVTAGTDEELTALLVLPLYVPVLIFGAAGVSAATNGLPFSGHMSVLGALLFASLALMPWAIAAAVRIALE